MRSSKVVYLNVVKPVKELGVPVENVALVAFEVAQSDAQTEVA